MMHNNINIILLILIIFIMENSCCTDYPYRIYLDDCPNYPAIWENNCCSPEEKCECGKIVIYTNNVNICYSK
ncbi:MAG TPA: hypothetical protein DEF85_04500 [Clostridiaceae bacterium]|nr:hypothetical protein [Clostridiaceae bacterium]